MTDTAIRVENLSKQYRIGKRERYRTLRDTLTNAVAPIVRPGSRRRLEPEILLVDEVLADGDDCRQ